VIARDTGLPAAMARAEVRAAIGAIRDELGSASASSAAPGIIGQILSWSNPLVASLRLAALDLVRGDVVIVHPSLKAPLSLVCLAEAMSRAGAPAGVFSLVQGAGIDVGAALARSKDLKRLDFQGSRVTARSVRRSPDRHGIPVQEVFRRVERRTLAPSGDVEALAAKVAASALAHAARVGFGGLEVRVPKPSLDALVAALRPAWGTVAYTEEAPDGRAVAPFAAERFRDAAEAQLDAWLDRGAELRLRATEPDERTRRMGWFVAPCVVHDVGDEIELDPEVPTGPLVLVKTR
jgi:betaine-aldehyde dehydrogenase